jgi:hypothetical protein
MLKCTYLAQRLCYKHRVIMLDFSMITLYKENTSFCIHSHKGKPFCKEEE